VTFITLGNLLMKNVNFLSTRMAWKNSLVSINGYS